MVAYRHTEYVNVIMLYNVMVLIINVIKPEIKIQACALQSNLI